MTIIGIGCKKRSGKDTVAQLIQKNCPSKRVKIIHFADALYIDAACRLGISVKEMQENKKVFRPFLQWYGTEYCRVYRKNDNRWINEVKTLIQAEKANKHYDIVIISDVRFRNEVEFVKGLGGTLVEVFRDSDDEDSHQSENDLDAVDWSNFAIFNNSTLENLEVEVCEMIQFYGWNNS